MTYLLQQYLSHSAERTPDHIFVKGTAESITFKAMDLFSNKLANLLVRNGLKRNTRACFFLRRSVDAFKGLFGILKADGIYVGINPKTPADRVRQILKD